MGDALLRTVAALTPSTERTAASVQPLGAGYPEVASAQVIQPGVSSPNAAGAVGQPSRSQLCQQTYSTATE